MINYRFGENGDGNDEEADGNQSTPLKGPLPKCGNLVCKGDPYGKFSPIEVSAFVDFIEVGNLSPNVLRSFPPTT